MGVDVRNAVRVGVNSSGDRACDADDSVGRYVDMYAA